MIARVYIALFLGWPDHAPQCFTGRGSRFSCYLCPVQMSQDKMSQSSFLFSLSILLGASYFAFFLSKRNGAIRYLVVPFIDSHCLQLLDSSMHWNMIELPSLCSYASSFPTEQISSFSFLSCRILRENCKNPATTLYTINM